MVRHCFIRLLAVLVGGIGGWGCSTAIAQDPPEVLRHFRALPRYSTLHQTGGIAGWDWRYRVMGEYDFVHTIGGARANFANAELWGSIISKDPTPAVVLDVDEVLNLEGLQGRALPVAAPFDVYQFQGKTGDGSSVNLWASVIGPWMYVRGGTKPPPGGADFFEYSLRMLARSRPFADLNEDGTVDAADYVLLRKQAAFASADGVTFADWSEQFGERVPDLAAYDVALGAALEGLSAGGGVPEPGSLALLLGSGLALLARRWR